MTQEKKIHELARKGVDKATIRQLTGFNPFWIQRVHKKFYDSVSLSLINDVGYIPKEWITIKKNKHQTIVTIQSKSNFEL